MLKNNDFLIFFFVSFFWSLTFPLVKYMRLMGINVWSISFYQCLFAVMILVVQSNVSSCFKKNVLCDLKILIILGVIRNFFGIVILNYLLLSQSITNVTIALLFIPFTTLILDTIIYHFKPSINQLKGIMLSIISIAILIYDFNHLNNIAWYYMPLTLSVSLLFGIEAIILSKINQKPNVILFWQNITGACLLICFILCLDITGISNVMLILPLNILYVVLFVSLLSIAANNLFIKLTKRTGPSLSTQINITVVLFSCVYDKAIYGSILMWHTFFLIILMIFSTRLILDKRLQPLNRNI